MQSIQTMRCELEASVRLYVVTAQRSTLGKENISGNSHLMMLKSDCLVKVCEVPMPIRCRNRKHFVPNQALGMHDSRPTSELYCREAMLLSVVDSYTLLVLLQNFASCLLLVLHDD